MTLFAFTRLFVRLSRRVLWVLMMLGHIISSFILRQMEFDADRYEAGLAGSDAFEATMWRLTLLAVANARAHTDLESAWADERLADDLPARVLANLESMPARVRREVEKEQGKAKTDLLDSHPADADRIRHARELAAAGIFQPDAPALRSRFRPPSCSATSRRCRRPPASPTTETSWSSPSRTRTCCPPTPSPGRNPAGSRTGKR